MKTADPAASSEAQPCDYFFWRIRQQLHNWPSPVVHFEGKALINGSALNHRDSDFSPRLSRSEQAIDKLVELTFP